MSGGIGRFFKGLFSAGARLDAALEDLKNGSPNVRKAAAEALGKIGDARAAAPLRTHLMWDPNSDVSNAAAKALGKIGTPAMELLIEDLKNDDVCERAAEALGKIGTPALEPLMAKLEDKGYCFGHTAAIEALGKIGTPAIEPLIAKLGDRASDVRRAVAAEALGEIGDARAVEPLIARLGDGSSDVRWVAVMALGKIGDARAVEPLIAKLGDTNPHVRWAAVVALEKIGDARAIEPLVAKLGDKDSDVRKRAAEALEKICTEKMTPEQRAVFLSNMEKAKAEGMKKAEAEAKVDYRAMLEEIYKIGRRCKIIGFIEISKDQYIAALSGCRNEDEKIYHVGMQYNYLVSVVNQMFNPPMDSDDVGKLKQIASYIKRP